MPKEYCLSVEKTMCPACYAQDEHILIHTVSSITAAKHFLRNSGARDFSGLRNQIQALWKSAENNIMRCVGCGSRFSNPHIAGDPKFYELAYPESSYPESRWEFDLTCDTVIDSLKDDGRLLEIGGGDGGFINQVVLAGLDPKRISVTEFSAEGRKNLEQLGVDVHEVDFRFGVPGGPFQVIVLFQTLEHLDRLDQVVNSFSLLGTKDVEVFLSAPNVECIDWQEKVLGMLDMPPNHITGFSVKGIRELFVRRGWTVVGLELQPAKTFLDCAKDIALWRLNVPSNRYEQILNKLSKIKVTPGKESRRNFCALLTLIPNITWMRKIPSENIWLHVKKVPIL